MLIGKPNLKSITDLKGKTISVGADNDITTVYFERMMAANGFKKGDYDTIPAGVAAARFAALKAGVVDAAIVLPPLNFQAAAAGLVTLGLAADYVKDVPFTGMAVHRRWAAANLSAAKRVLAPPTKASPGSRTRRTAAKRSSFWSRSPVQQGGCRRQLRLSSPDRFFRAHQQGLAHEIAQSGRDGAARRDRRSGIRHRRLAMPGLTELTD